MAGKTVEERLTIVERKVAENAHRIDGLREAIAELGNRMDRRFEALEQHFDRRFEAVDRRFETIDRRFEALEQRHTRQFLWLTGTLAATMLAVVSILSAALLGG